MEKEKGTVSEEVKKYLSGVDEPFRSALDELRNDIRKIIPGADEVISYGMPTFRYEGRGLVACAATKKDCSFHTMSRLAVSAFREELKDFKTTIEAVHFTKEKPVPPALVKKIVSLRIEENRRRA